MANVINGLRNFYGDQFFLIWKKKIRSGEENNDKVSLIALPAKEAYYSFGLLNVDNSLWTGWVEIFPIL